MLIGFTENINSINVIHVSCIDVHVWTLQYTLTVYIIAFEYLVGGIMCHGPSGHFCISQQSFSTLSLLMCRHLFQMQYTVKLKLASYNVWVCIFHFSSFSLTVSKIASISTLYAEFLDKPLTITGTWTHIYDICVYIHLNLKTEFNQVLIHYIHSIHICTNIIFK